MSRGLSHADILATATRFTARSIADAYKSFIIPHHSIDEVIVSGGGAHNQLLMAMLSELLPEMEVKTLSSIGLNSDAKEAVIFALLGNDFMKGICNNLPSATGASKRTVMGKLALP